MSGFVSRYNEYIGNATALKIEENNNNGEVTKFVADVIRADSPDRAFFVFDIQNVIDKHETWSRLLPRVRPFYSVKANNSQMLLEVMAGLGAGFDVVSQSEFIQALSIPSVSPEKDVLYANPIKSVSELKIAQKQKINLMTFDNEAELLKHAEHYPDAKLILRIRVEDDSNSVQPFGNKYGVQLKNVREILALASKLGLIVVGVSFHVGCRTSDEFAFEKAIRDASKVFLMAKHETNFEFTILNIGGGFPGADWHAGIENRDMFSRIANSVRSALEIYFPADQYSELEIIAEPGTYYCASAFHLAAQIIGKRIDVLEDKSKYAHYYINDGLFGSFFGPLWGYPAESQNMALPITPLIEPSKLFMRPVHLSTIWGQTLASLDVVAKDIQLSEFNCNEWLVFKDMGDYSVSLVTGFCGFKPSKVLYYANEGTKNILPLLPNGKTILDKL